MNFEVVVWTTQFKRDYKNAIKRGYQIELLDDVIRKLAKGETLPERYKDHELIGNWVGYRECHIKMTERR